MLYLIVLIILILASYQYDYKNKTTGKYELYILICILFISIVGLRYRIGGDTIHYENQYFETPSLFNLTEYTSSSLKFEPGFTFIMSLFRTIFPSSFFPFQYCISVFINVVFFSFFYKNSKHPYTAVIFYYFFSYFYLNCEILRQAIAISIFLTAWTYLKNCEWIKYYILSFLAFSIHSSGIICILLPLFFIKPIRVCLQINKRYLLFILIVTGLVIVGNSMFIEYIYQLNLLSSLNDKMLSYSSRMNEETSIGLSNIISALTKNVLYPTIAVFSVNRTSTKISSDLQIIIALNGILGILSVGIDMIFRVGIYFLPFVILVLSQWCYSPLHINKKYYRISYSTWILLLFPLLISPINSFKSRIEGTDLNMGMRYYPYHSIIFPEKDRNRERLYDFFNS